MVLVRPESIVDLDRYPIADLAQEAGQTLVANCRAQLLETGACVLNGFLRAEQVPPVLDEVEDSLQDAFYDRKHHNVYLAADDRERSPDHPRNRSQMTDSATLAYDLIPKDCRLERLYHWRSLQDFIASVLGFERLHPMADPLGALNLLVYRDGSQTGWHFDNANFVVTLMLRPAEQGGRYQYAPFVRLAEDEGLESVVRILGGEESGLLELEQGPGALVLFQGRNTLHRVTPVAGAKPRVIAVLSYDPEPGTVMSAHTQKIFYGRAA